MCGLSSSSISCVANQQVFVPLNALAKRACTDTPAVRKITFKKQSRDELAQARTVNSLDPKASGQDDAGRKQAKSEVDREATK